ncbi:hypothetical protein [Halochromatium roseum]|uniref:hypothetical protein n=1 Tax=Halochromatium roseum TaxID=391920 RepID=UPI0019127E8A|nr:hypothetical protein [Halochromatium roseum]MBK5938242.1 hypothetical protein [Halochromatium roseum]
MKTFNQREYEAIKNTFITAIENPAFMNDPAYLALLKEEFDTEDGINPKILDYVFGVRIY